MLKAQSGPTVVAGHSYGGQIMTALGTDAPNVVALVYVAAFGLDEGESIGGLLAGGEPTPALAHLRIDDEGAAWLPQDDFVKHFAADVDPIEANVMYAVQQPLAASALGDVMGTPAWKSLPTWFAVSQNDEAIPPDAERLFAKRMGATVERTGGGPRRHGLASGRGRDADQVRSRVRVLSHSPRASDPDTNPELRGLDRHCLQIRTRCAERTVASGVVAPREAEQVTRERALSGPVERCERLVDRPVVAAERVEPVLG